eukprot:CAMPEP_0201546586 /NCGR_PEP_ID=MMETSP0173_2-20130828/2843_1 /ASSEMBLY_ACC=CAM_ASM_000268 /TAXON_ID=218659 /ORGANISM="Vexillifera sp., Strain DIVA3 564/2" /LENGTH=299 /DNA_ID=CAMNT_0047955277 /DNA_START=26 /DNA_END=925 /DNA_ORIENTATION=-
MANYPQGGYGAPPPSGYGGAGGYPPQGGRGGYGSPGGYPPQGGYGGAPAGYPPQGGRGGYGSPGGYPPQGGRGGYGAPGGYPPQGGRGGYGPPGGAGGWNPNQSVAGFKPTQSQLGGFGGQYYAQLDPMRVAELRGWFDSADKDRSGEITASELAQMQFGGKKFSLATAKKLMKVFDTDLSNTIGFFEYAALHQFITSIQAAFYMFDKDKSGKLDQTEVTHALQQAGFAMSPNTIKDVYKKFQSGNTTFGRNGLTFEQFLALSAYLGQIRATFFAADTDRDGWISLNLEKLIQLATHLG